MHIKLPIKIKKLIKVKDVFVFLFLSLSILFCININTSFAEEESAMPSGSVELNGDVVEYSIDGNKIIAEGNVVLIYKGSTLSCDRLEFERDTKMAYAEGEVHLKTDKGVELSGNKLNFNFETMTGDFKNAKVSSEPYFGEGKKVAKVDENEILVYDGYVSTSDFDKPEYRLRSKKIEVYPGKKLVARGVSLVLGNIPVMYLPRYTQRLDDKKPRFTFTPGYDKDWGIFLLTQWRYYFNENFKGTVHLDARERKDIAWGIDLDYKTKKMGEGLIRTYYMNERSITSKRFYQERPTPTIEKERFKVEWRHKWEIDKNTNAILQYYKLSDNAFLKDYFRSEYDEDSSPETFFLFTRELPKGTLTFRTEARVNRFESAVERLPEVRYDFSNQRIGRSDFYFKNKTTYSNLTSKKASPSEVRQNTSRLDSDNELSYLKKIGVIEFKPYVGLRETYYSKTKDPDEYDSVRTAFRTGASLSTKFFKIMEVQKNIFGIEINRLRHIITPTIAYDYAHEPTLTANQLDSFDDIDNLERAHTINFAIENKLQTKRGDETVDLLRAILSTDFRLKEHPTGGGFDKIKAEIDFKPIDWLTFYFDSEYDTRKDHLNTANFDLYINGKDDKWSFGLGKRFHQEVDDQITVGFSYKINEKWAFKVYERYDTMSGTQKEQQFTLTRDLHSWLMDINFNERRGEGSEILLVFTLKAFPDMGFDIGTGFNKRKAGSQTSEGE